MWESAWEEDINKENTINTLVYTSPGWLRLATPAWVLQGRASQSERAAATEVSEECKGPHWRPREEQADSTHVLPPGFQRQASVATETCRTGEGYPVSSHNQVLT